MFSCFHLCFARRGGTNSLRCSGRGTCECNTCICDTTEDPRQMIFGAACECDNFMCPRTGISEFMEVCSGLGNEHCFMKFLLFSDVNG